MIPMSVSKKIPLGEHRLGAQYLELRETLRLPQYSRHLEKRLAFWVSPSDRRLPIVLLGRTVQEILEMSLEELLRYPSIGEKKFSVLVALLARVANTSEIKLPSLEQPLVSDLLNIPSSEGENSSTFINRESQWNNVSEFEWNHWQQVVLEQGLENEVIGHLCNSLEEMPRVLWNKPLSTYCHVSLDELRAMKTHGERRIHAILHLFHDIYEVASKFNGVPRLKIRMSLRWTDDVQLWMSDILAKNRFPEYDTILERFVNPCLAQLRVDSAEGVVQLAEFRLGLSGPITSVRQVAKDMGLARARVYQILGQISEIMSVRWPEGKPLVHQLRDKCIYEMIDCPTSSAHELFMSAAELFYPVGKFISDYRPESRSSESSHERLTTIAGKPR